MRKILLLLLSLAIVLCLCACQDASKELAPQSVDSPVLSSESSDETSSSQTVQSEQSAVPKESSIQPARIKLTVDGQSAIVELLDNAAAKDLISMLPLTLSFEDYNNTEKIATLPRELSLGDAPTSCDPDIGTFAYYAPWGNLSVFYQDFRNSENLIPLGVFESGVELFSENSGSFSVTIEMEGMQ